MGQRLRQLPLILAAIQLPHHVQLGHQIGPMVEPDIEVGPKSLVQHDWDEHSQIAVIANVEPGVLMGRKFRIAKTRMPWVQNSASDSFVGKGIDVSTTGRKAVADLSAQENCVAAASTSHLGGDAIPVREVIVIPLDDPIALGQLQTEVSQIRRR